jgi:DNA-binding transcriptional ArsR family regulator
VVVGADGRSAGAIGEALGDTSPSRLSFYLNQLQQSGLIESRRVGRSIIYSAILTALSDLVAFLMHDCCEGHWRVCDQAIALFAKCTGRPTPAASLAEKIDDPSVSYFSIASSRAIEVTTNR